MRRFLASAAARTSVELFAAAVSAVVVALVSASLFAETPLLNQAFASGGSIRLDLSAGDYEIVGTSSKRIRIESRRDDNRGVHVRFDAKGNAADIELEGRLTRGVDARIEVPQQTHLIVKLSAGEMRIRGVEGSKDISARAGEISIQVGRRDQYRRVDASVSIGELAASAFNVDTGGFLRSFSWAGKGRYDLRARLTVGELNLVP